MTTWIFWRLTNRGGDYSALHAKKPGASYETLCGRRYDPYTYRMADELPEGYPRCKRCEARLPEPNGNGRRCPYFGQDVPAEFTGCAECGVKQECYEAWDKAHNAYEVFNEQERQAMRIGKLCSVCGREMYRKWSAEFCGKRKICMACGPDWTFDADGNVKRRQ